jgi:hypothetical protein
MSGAEKVCCMLGDLEQKSRSRCCQPTPAARRPLSERLRDLAAVEGCMGKVDVARPIEDH